MTAILLRPRWPNPLIIWHCFLFQTTGLGATSPTVLDEFFLCLHFNKSPNIIYND